MVMTSSSANAARPLLRVTNFLAMGLLARITVGLCFLLLCQWLFILPASGQEFRPLEKVDAALSNQPSRAGGPTPGVDSLLPANAVSPLPGLAGDDFDSVLKPTDELPNEPIKAALVFASLLPLDAGERVNVTQLLVMQEDFSGSLDLFPFVDIAMGVRLQNLDAEQGDFVSVKSTAMDVTIEADVELQFDLLASAQQAVPVFRLNDVSFYRGDQIEIVYQNLQLPGRIEHPLQLPLKLRLYPLDPGLTDPEIASQSVPFEETGLTDAVWQTLEGESRQIKPGKAVQVNVVVPQIVKTGQAFQPYIDLLDRYGNPANGPLPSFDILLDGSFVARADSNGNDDSRLQIPEQRVAVPGLHRISVRSTGGGLRGQSPLILATDNPAFDLHWTDFSPRSLGSLEQDQNSQLSDTLTELDSYPPTLLATIESETRNQFDSRIHYRRIADGGSWLELRYDTGTAAVLLAELTGDRRRASTSLIQLLAGPSAHEWLLAYYAELGSTFGVAATQASLQPRGLNSGPATAILAKPGETWFQALSQGRTYVTNGTKAIVLWDLNGTPPGARARYSQERVMNLDIYSDVPVVQVDWLKNSQVLNTVIGEPLETVAIEGEAPSRLVPTKRLWLNISLYSAAEPIRPGLSLPRNAREWLGYIKMAGLKLITISAPVLDKVSDSAIAINPNDPNRVDFLGWTHGSWISFRAQVEIPAEFPLTAADLNEPAVQPALISVGESPGLDDDPTSVGRDGLDLLAIQLHIREGFEDVLFLPRIREPSATPGLEELVTLNSLQVESFHRDLIANGYRDKVVMSIEPELTSQAASFSYKDTLNLLPGDYYHARIRLQNGAFIWTSPFFVGGFDAVFPE